MNNSAVLCTFPILSLSILSPPHPIPSPSYFLPILSPPHPISLSSPSYPLPILSPPHVVPSPFCPLSILSVSHFPFCLLLSCLYLIPSYTTLFPLLQILPSLQSSPPFSSSNYHPPFSLPFLILFHFILSWPLPSSGVLTSNKKVDSSISFHAFLKIFAFLNQIFRSSIQDVDVG